MREAAAQLPKSEFINALDKLSLERRAITIPFVDSLGCFASGVIGCVLSGCELQVATRPVDREGRESAAGAQSALNA